MSQSKLLCPVCGGVVEIKSRDAVTRCDYCGSPVLGQDQDRYCVNHPDTLAKAVCNVCGDLICEKDMEKRVGNYGGKLFTIINCKKPSCIRESEWAKPVNPEYERLTNMDWADKIDNSILRITGIGALLLLIFELLFFISMVYIQFFTPWGQAGHIGVWFIRGDQVIVLSIIGNFITAMILQTALQVYVHERQLGAGLMLFVLLVLEVFTLLYRGLQFGLLQFPDPFYLPLLFGAFIVATLLILIGALLAIRIGWKKRNQLEDAKIKLGLH